MTSVVCVPEQRLPKQLQTDTEYFSLFSAARWPQVGTVANGWPALLEKAGFSPSEAAWDFATMALSVSAADLACERKHSADGWTRIIDLKVALHNPAPFAAISADMENVLRFLTGDFWHLHFVDGGAAPPRTTALADFDADCVSLLSGGVDSLVGGIDLVAKGRRPIFVSQMAKGDSETQIRYAAELGASQRHLQWNHNIRVPHATERSTRGRSIVFFAFALIAADAMRNGDTGPKEIVVPENGFISLNVPLNPGRLGSLSTRTTHPIFLDGLERIWKQLGLNVTLTRPYQFHTKGEVLQQCLDQKRLRELVGESTSCGRFGYYNYTHCGRCVPCLVRRAAFRHIGWSDPTPTYHFSALRSAGRKSGANDIGAVASACVRYQQGAIDRFIGGALSFSPSEERSSYEGVIVRGLAELSGLLSAEGVL